MLWASEAPGPGAAFADPGTWVNFGVLGVIFVGWATGWLPSKNEITRLEEDKTRLIDERNRANAERDEAYEVIRDFNQMAAALLQKIPTLTPTPRTRRKPSDGETR